jgi:hypothetical protein
VAVSDLDARVDAAPEAELPAIIGELEAARARAWARLTAPSSVVTAPAVAGKWLTPLEAAEFARASKRQVYEWAVGKRWAHRPSRRKLLIDEQGFRAWLASRP